MKTAVVYYSLEGNVKFVAEKIAGALGADIVPLVPVKAYPDRGFSKFLWGGKAAVMKDEPELEPYSFRAEDYGTVILASPVWAGTFTPPLRTFLRDNDLSGKKIAVIASSTSGNGTKCIKQLEEGAHASSLVAAMSLVDPKTKQNEENERKITAFVEAVKNEE